MQTVLYILASPAEAHHTTQFLIPQPDTKQCYKVFTKESVHHVIWFNTFQSSLVTNITFSDRSKKVTSRSYI